MVVALLKIDVPIETDDAAQVERLKEAIEPTLCPHESGSAHRCPNCWFPLSSELNEPDAARWEPLLNE